MLVMVTGGSGMLGRQIVRQLKERKIPYVAPTHSQMDITKPQSVSNYFQAHEPDVVIHCAAWTQVDLAESKPVECMEINALGTQHIATAVRFCNAKLVYVSTDYVFGDDDPMAIHTPTETPNPLNIYGLSKLQGEYAVRSLLSKWFIVRAGWLYDPDCHGFVRTILSQAYQKQPLRVVNDQFGAPTWVCDLAPALVNLAMTERYGYHAAVPEGSCTWYEFAQAIMRLKGLRTKIEPVTSAEWDAPARRPASSRMAPTIRLPHWQQSLQNALTDTMVPSAEKIISLQEY